jgi:arsenite-transporting ATPase
VIIVTLPEATPVHEAARLQADLRPAGIEPCAWITNQSFLGSNTADPILASKVGRKAAFIEEVLRFHPERVAIPLGALLSPLGNPV